MTFDFFRGRSFHVQIYITRSVNAIITGQRSTCALRANFAASVGSFLDFGFGIYPIAEILCTTLEILLPLRKTADTCRTSARARSAFSAFIRQSLILRRLLGSRYYYLGGEGREKTR